MVYLLLFGAAFFACVINSIAGGGSFLTFPSLVFAGVPAVMANASSTVALVPGSVASAISYRSDIEQLDEQHIKSWWIICILFATLLFAFGPQVSVAFRGRLHSNQPLMLMLLFPIAVYGAYFGGGIGIMILAAFRLYGFTDIHGMNGIKAILGGSLNAIAAIIFISAREVRWLPALVMMVAAILGGYLGPAFARRLRPTVIRSVVIAVGILMTAYFFHISPR